MIKTIVALFGLVFCLFCLWTAGQIGLSRLSSIYAANAGQLEAADTATRLTPSDPEAHLIRAALLKADNRFDEAIHEYEQAAALRARDYVLWLEVGLARDQAEDEGGAIEAFKEAVALAPDYAEPHWQLGNALLRSGRMDEAFQEMRRAAQSNQTLLPQLIDLAWNIYQADVSSVEQAVQPQNPPARLALARFAARHGKALEGARIFRTVENLSEEDRREFLKELLSAKQFKIAYEVWLTIPGRSASHSTSGFTDGGFEEQIDLEDQGFGWQIARNLASVRASLDRAEPHHGGSSLRLDLSGDPPPAAPLISQLILVEPGARYRLRFAARTEELVTGGLPLITITDSSGTDAQLLAHSDPLQPKTAPWQDYTLEFAAGQGTRAVLITLQRQSCTSSPCPVFGSLWLDDFSIEKL